MTKKRSKSEDQPSDAARFLQSLQDAEVVERVRATVQNAHVFKLPPRQSTGWRGADWKEKVWQGTVKVVERADLTAVLLVDRNRGSIFAVCPIKEGAVERCVDSSRYFVLRIENANGRHMFIGVAFNERTHSFDFCTALEDAKKEREREEEQEQVEPQLPIKDYSLKEGEKVKLSIPRTSGSKHKRRSSTTKSSLRPSPRDTPGKRPGDEDKPKMSSADPFGSSLDTFLDDDKLNFGSFGGKNFFAATSDDQSTQSANPFFKKSTGKKKQSKFDPSQYKTESKNRRSGSSPSP